MSAKQKTIDIEGIKILSTPKFIIGIISVTFLVALHFFTFLNMKSDLLENREETKSIGSQMSQQKTEFYKEFQKIHSVTANIEGKLELLIKD